ncbi:MAG: hypothetical protein MJ178_05360 [Treponemataceae bacterium]|nr:hypothetical protein [Treponemataceae bacterium]
MTFSKRFSVSLISSILLLSPAGVVYAKSGAEQLQLQEIDRHIDNRDYNEALKMLSEFVRTNPDRFDQAQKRIDRIMDSREHLTQLAEELVNVIETDPENDELKLDLIDRIENIEINPSPQMSAFLASTRRAAEFAVNRIKFQNIITEGSRLAHASDYTAAVQSQIAGFSVYYDTFVRENDAETVAGVDRQIAGVKEQVSRFDAISTEAENAIAALKGCLERDETAASLRALTRVESAMTAYARLRNDIAETGYRFQEQYEQTADEQEAETDASYLPFAWRFILGTSSEPDSGMTGAMDLLWNSMLESAKPYALQAALSHFDAFIPLSAGTDTASLVAVAPEAEKQLSDAQLYLNIGEALDGFYALRKTGADTLDVSPDPQYDLVLSDMRNVGNWIQGLIIHDGTFQKTVQQVAVRPYEQVASAAGSQIAAGDFSWFTLMTESAQRMGVLYDAAVEYSGGIMSVTGRLQDLDGQVTSRQFLDYALNLGLSLQTESSSYRNMLQQWMQQYINAAAVAIAESAGASYTEAYELLNDALDPEVSSYPQKVGEQTALLLPRYARSSEQLLSLASLASSGCNTDLITRTVETLADLTAQTTALQAKADDRILQAQRIYAEGELRYSEARKAITRDDYSSARTSLQRAGSKYAESFLYREDAALRAHCDAKLVALGEEINRLENERIVLEVRRLKKQAKTEYYAGNFELADSLLQQAKARWLVTNVDDDPEIVQLLALVGTALSMKTGRTLSPSAALYPEMSQTLNIAHSFYAEGEALLKKGQREAGVAALQNAQQKIRELQLVYPLNQEASLMSLQIDKLIDPAAFEVYFAQKVQSAKAEYREKEKQRQVYADLLDLYEINPSYPGLKDFIYTVEIELGIRQKPIDRTAQNQSAALYKEAVALYNKNSRDEINLRSALAKVDEALTKNPDNEEAQTLKDRINIALGGSGSVVLPSEAENLYQKAVQELQKGNTIQAAAIVMQLMQNPEYAKSAKILDLQKKVDSLL